ncbi:MAG: CHAP domain-containing protein [Ferruginibacter sp.]|nr:CHAP domain-containing protein [Ferruginibacter sp.]
MNYPNRIIKAGETNKTIVKAIQQKLNDTGVGPVGVIGIYGPKTINAVKLFQATHRDQEGNPLEIDGKIGSVTWAVLFGQQTIPVVVTASTNSLLSEAVSIAVSQIGVMEDPPGSNRGKKVEEYLGSIGLGGGFFWCAAFVYWCFQKAAEKQNRKNPVLKTGHCMTHWRDTSAKKILAPDAVNKPDLIKPGQIFIINTGGANGHTGIIESVEGGFIHTIEGNSNPQGSSNGIGVFRNTRKIAKINRGFLEYK